MKSTVDLTYLGAPSTVNLGKVGKQKCVLFFYLKAKYCKNKCIVYTIPNQAQYN